MSLDLQDKVTEALRAWSAVFMRRTAHEMQVAIRQTGLSPSQVGTLFRLHYHGACPISDLGDSLDLTTAAASHLVERLVQMGLLARSEDSIDRRVRLVTLTAEGERMVARMIDARRQWLHHLTSALKPDQQEEVVRALGYLTQASLAEETEGTLEIKGR